MNPTGSVRASHAESPELAEILKEAWPIEATEACTKFELAWGHYVAYLVTEESVGSCGDAANEIEGRSSTRVMVEALLS